MAEVKQEESTPTGTKVFVGNLSFSVNKEALEKHFAEVGKVLSANVITRGNRSRGYGFVEMSTLEEAEAAVKRFHHQDIESRPVNVEIARPRTAAPDRENAGRGRGGRGGRGRGGRGRGRGGRGGRGGGRGRGRRFIYREGEGNQQPNEGGDRPRRQSFQRQAKQNREPSADTLFVANLAFAMKDDELLALFKEFSPSEAHVVVGRSGRSKGFGFVKFGNSADQQNALKRFEDKVESMGRTLTVKVALNPEQGNAAPQGVEQKAS